MNTSMSYLSSLMVNLLLAVTMWFDVGANPLSDPCSGAKDRSRDQLHETWSELHYNATVHESFYMTPTYKANIEDVLESTGKTFYYSGERDCPSTPSSEASLENRSLCPWYWVINYDVNRYPDELAEVRCSCPYCVGSTSRQCERIIYNIIVLRKNENKCTGGYFDYDMGYQRVAVGCTCAIPDSSS